MHNKTAGVTAILILLTFGTSSGFAQAPSAAPGSTVRVAVTGQRDKLVGTLVEQTTDSLVVALPADSGALRRFGVNQVTRLETWVDRPNAVAKGWLVGTGVGVLAGILVGSTTDPPCGGSGWCIGPRDQGDMLAVGALGGAIVGGIVGLIAGATNRSGWVPLDIAVIRSQSSPAAGVQVSWRVTLPAIRAPE